MLNSALRCARYALCCVALLACGDDDTALSDTGANDTDSVSDTGSQSDSGSDGGSPDVGDAAADTNEPADTGETPPNDELPPELATRTLVLLHADTFDDQDDFQNPTRRSFCSGSTRRPECDDMPAGWTGYSVAERWHPEDMGDSVEAGLQINSANPRGGSGKSLVIWDESYGTPSQWGSDAMLSKRLDRAYRNVYAEYWMYFPEGYRWHHAGEHGINYAKILRLSHVDAGDYAFSYGGDGTNDPVMIVNTHLWFVDRDGTRSERGALTGVSRCSPRATNYRCGDWSGSIRGDVESVAVYGDGEWHKVGALMSAGSPGGEDGVVTLWFDNVQVVETRNIPFLATGVSADRQINTVTFGGNQHNYPEPEEAQFEQWYAIDDVRIFAVDPE